MVVAKVRVKGAVELDKSGCLGHILGFEAAGIGGGGGEAR